jgi:hypothetical protein
MYWETKTLDNFNSKILKVKITYFNNKNFIYYVTKSCYKENLKCSKLDLLIEFI